ncbi:MAG: hypothetical protein IJQ68_08415 [Methanobrevibacter sp.]|uniref:hypothetical protein n=1 Tax=Methanobrevibacter sp. TaxID=66852 RepID=UPI0025FA48A9|nr:hypothetical protein [Methanobrevibacter sp.]MBR0271994.1 hypothetical protein [Methanobrevibacter sp.]
MSKNICPRCGAVTEDGYFCYQCGFKFDNKSFFNKMDEKISISTLIFSFIVLGIFLFVGSLFWGLFTANGTIGFSTNVLLTVIFAVFFAGIFLGYFNCMDDSYIVPNFIVYLGVIAAGILCATGSLFAVTTAFASAMSSVFSSSPLTSGYADVGSVSGASDTNIFSSLLSNFLLDIVIIILLIPAASYLGIYLGYIIKNNL